MDAKAWLSRGIRLRAEKDQLERLREQTYTRLTKVTQNISGEAVSGTKDPHKLDAIVTLDGEIESRIRELDRIRLEIYDTIQRLPDRRQRVVLRGRYLEDMSWEEIAVTVHYSKRQVERLHGMALTAIEPLILEGR